MDKWSKLRPRLVLLLELFSSRVFEVLPDDILEFSSEFFSELNSKPDKWGIFGDRHRAETAKLPYTVQLIPTSGTPGKPQPDRGTPVYTVSPAEAQQQSITDVSEEYTGESGSLLAVEGQEERPACVSPCRRQSVAAESFDPEIEDSGESVVYPKTAAQRQRINEAIQSIFIFRSLDETQLNKVVDAMQEVPVQKDQVIIRQGEDGEYFYIIESGSYDVFVEGEPAGNYNGAGYFGELALMYNTPRAATIKCTSDGILWRVDRFTFRRIVLKQAFRKRQLYETWLSNVPLLKNLNFYERKNLADALVSVTFEDGSWIVRQGEPGEVMYFIEEGDVQISVNTSGGGSISVKTLHEGDYFGELALILHAPRQASAMAVGKTVLAALDVRSFERLMGPCLNVMLREVGQYRSELINILGEASLNSFSALARLSTFSTEEDATSTDKGF
ncbi:cAMP-dependent protein kinase regulator [Clonorchis sinensis]|uniref:cGMP-dependent protein kinase n=1 Tax=Clonorchis sinensis TaxID=79923 RepID=H2KQ71_CLOSI|nr:cAMP-dependent protein kinase regulator [Clonorchis sinensis]